MNAEIERKYLIDPDKLPFSLEELPGMRIEQCYLLWNDQGEEARIRNIGDAFKLTYKRGEGILRQEVEIDITGDQYKSLRPLTEGRRLRKTRYYRNEGGYTVEIDVYTGKAKGLVVAEVEFKSAEEYHAFKPFPWFGREISEIEAYRNRNLAVE